MKKLNKKNLLVSAVSVVTAATLLFSGATYAYLQDETEDKVNTFNPNKVLVDLVETKGPEYEIIPGTTVDKDPVVYVDNTVPAYVYVEVNDTSNGLIKYELEDGWVLLDGTDNVYYREVAAKETPEADPQAFHFIKGDKVSFDKSIQNSDMTKEDGKTLVDPYTLTFKASAVQKEPFTDALQAYKLGTAETVKEAKDIQTALDQGGTVAADNDINVVYTKANPTTSVATLKDNNTLYLDGHTVDIKTESGKNGIVTEEGSVASIENGTIVQDKAYGSSYAVINVNHSTLTLDNVTVKLDSTGADTCVSAGSDGGKLIIKNSTIQGSTSKYANTIFVGSGSEVVLENTTVIGIINPMVNAKVYINSGDYTQTTFKKQNTSNYLISGGTFAVNPTTFGKIMTGYEAIANADGTYSVVANA